MMVAFISIFCTTYLDFSQKVNEKDKPLLSISNFVQAARNNVLLPVPALLYAINNYLKFTMQLYFNPATVALAPPERIQSSHRLLNLFLYGYGAIFKFLGIIGTVVIKGPESFDILQGHSKATMSKSCLHLGWLFNTNSSFLLKPSRKSKGLTIIAFNDGKINSETIHEVLSALDNVLMYGGYSTTKTLLFHGFLSVSFA
ncbi:hypothetical protein L2E82_30762 [Cichorium intybus]|uniref:Uncharacterized protein n=1 Tax=Cichorium intybus TaxID=13427 RepID=A0ACB9D170_CICIN|nr:hypothetical protein L2E82_30762 [Cichorium intybus]